ncbi:ADP-forming succinate--CoA ligase subunit beta [Blochmannia endosymbiont of Camponotus (Colobopsis) obliquus]|uniref:ADP-forming succinate--CoA ligase subunit beta n=1 Tax=Blochmannia endosymbiont of Camponotus (Colobopsis) obliquus TaxID=1505597 RepID=UPI00061A6DC3|nr:ADP-forming succinate--CoA ligase subunit beta [Blochmannia endosymbiont of Camponotus (Colobopsis) obliquus]AKC60497.1 succinyl-CoA ligase [ADP-forming] subunit beta [Blochmannia endosymbiont of Camponotus (Colobopsis) obliquus]
MNLHEYQAKQLFVQYDLPIPKGVVCSTFYDVERYFLNAGYGPWVLKCQIYAGGRGKQGGVQIVSSKKEALTFAKHWLGNRLVTHQTDVIGQPVDKILIENYINVKKELYFGIVIDRNKSRVMCVVSIAGGVDIEKITKTSPHLLHQVTLHPLIGGQLYQGRVLGYKLGLNVTQVNQFSKIFMSSASMFYDNDLLLAEINPLVIDTDDNLICLDGKINVDNNACFRQTKLFKMYDDTQEDTREVYAKKLGLSYVSLKGNIGCMVNGAGLAMATMDIVKFYGGEVANFLDVGGNVTKGNLIKALEIILFDQKVKSVLINIFGGIVCCDLVAESIIETIISNSVTTPIVVRLEGNNAKFGYNRLINSRLNINIANTLIDAIQQIITITK